MNVNVSRPEARTPLPLDVMLHHALADELVALTHILSNLAYDLGSNPTTLRAHMESLQAIDRLNQTQLAIADVLRSGETVDRRVRAITLEELSTRLSERLRLDSAPSNRRRRGQATASRSKSAD